MTRPTLAYIGLGLMGAPMTRRLITAGYTVHVWNRSREKLQPALAAGAIPAETPRAAVEAADIVFMCLFDAKAVEAVVFGEEGIAAAAGSAKVLVDHASIRPDKTREFAARLKSANGMDWIDAPVSGGVKGATEGSLAIMCGGDAAAYERARPVMSAYAANVNLMGPSGAGQVTKLCNQVICGTTMVVIAEAVRLAQNAGVDARLLPRALAGGFADSKPFQILVPRMIDRPAESIGAADTMLKDLDTAVDLGRENRTPLPVAGLAAQLLRTLAAQGKGGEEISAIIDLYDLPRPGR
jgi:3-hydroxyisobutyrate dehydrogenase